jgi:hypothetical protein
VNLDIEDRLRRDLAAAVAAPVRPAPPLELLDHQARTTAPLAPAAGPVASSSRSRRFALVGVAAAIVILVGAIGSRPWRVGTSADATPSCRDNFAEPGPPEEAEGLRYLPDEIPAGFHLSGASAHVEKPCKPRTAALILIDEADGLLRRAITVWGPDATDVDFFGSDSAVRDDGSPSNRQTTVRGTVAKLHETLKFDGHTLGWTEPGSGQHWIVTSRGVGLDELLSLVEALHVGVGEVSVDEAAAPGFHSEPIQPAPPTGKQVSWGMTYEPESGAAVDSGISVGVSRGDLLAAMSSRGGVVELTDVDGHRSATFSNGTTHFLEIQLATGVRASASGPVSFAELEHLVASLQPVAANDPRIRPLPDN